MQLVLQTLFLIKSCFLALTHLVKVATFREKNVDFINFNFTTTHETPDHQEINPTPIIKFKTQLGSQAKNPKPSTAIHNRQEVGARAVWYDPSMHREIHRHSLCLQIHTKEKAHMQRGLRRRFEGDSDNAPFIGASERCQNQRDL